MSNFLGCRQQPLPSALGSDKFALHSPVFSPFGEAKYDRHLSPSKTPFYPPLAGTETALVALDMKSL